MELGRLQEHLDVSWHELQTLCEREARFNFGVPKMLASELELIAMRIVDAKLSANASTLEGALNDTQRLVKRLRSLARATHNTC